MWKKIQTDHFKCKNTHHNSSNMELNTIYGSNSAETLYCIENEKKNVIDGES